MQRHVVEGHASVRPTTFLSLPPAPPPRARCVWCDPQDVPREELWECRKNALSEDIRRYLDTGILPRKHPPSAADANAAEGRNSLRTRDSALQERAKLSSGEGRPDEDGNLEPLQDERDIQSKDCTPEDPEALIAMLYHDGDGDDCGDY